MRAISIEIGWKEDWVMQLPRVDEEREKKSLVLLRRAGGREYKWKVFKEGELLGG